jgi:hypothetical protein
MRANRAAGSGGAGDGSGGSSAAGEDASGGGTEEGGSSGTGVVGAGGSSGASGLECFRFYGRCENGTVTVSQPRLCAKSTTECREGCRKDGVSMASWGSDLSHTLCEENRPRLVGDPCDNDLDCAREEPPEAGSDRLLLACDAELGTCIASSAKTPDDYLTDCGLSSVPGLGVRFGALVNASDCRSGICLLLYPEVEPSTEQYCTALCAATSDCPTGSSCLPVPVDESTDVTITTTLACVPD